MKTRQDGADGWKKGGRRSRAERSRTFNSLRRPATALRPTSGLITARRQVLRSPRAHMFASPAVNFHSKVFPSPRPEGRVISLRGEVTPRYCILHPCRERRVLKLSSSAFLNHDDDDGDDGEEEVEVKLPLSPETTHFEITLLAPRLPTSFRGAASAISWCFKEREQRGDSQ